MSPEKKKGFESIALHVHINLGSLIYMVMPIYISEVSPSQSRGMLGTLIGPGYAGGILIALCANIWFSEFTIGWRVATSIQAASGLLFAVGAWWVPRTPR